MSALYGKLWNKKMSMSTKGAHREITAQLLYGSRDNSNIAAEVYVKRLTNGEFVLFVDVPSEDMELVIELPSP